MSAHGLTAGQVLVTLGDTEERRRYLNARSTIAKLLEWRGVPVINENDTVATSEIRYGDNDRLAARVATMMSADLLVLLSDVDGLYDKPPAQARRQAGAAGRAHHAGDRGDGGRLRLRARARRHADQDRGRQDRHHRRHAHDHRLGPRARIRCRRSPTARACTWFLTPANPVTARKKWIAGSLEPRGALVIDAGAVKALRSGKSLLPAGVVKIEGAFGRGDAVVVRGPDGAEIGRGLIAYDAEDAEQDQGPLLGGYPRHPRLRRADRDDPPRRSCSGRGIVRRTNCSGLDHEACSANVWL